MDDSQRPRQVAAQLLRRLRMRPDFDLQRPVDMDLVARELGLDVETFHPATRRTGMLGWLEPGERLVFLRDGLPESTRRFTLAHEIGHFLLHRGEADDEEDDGNAGDALDQQQECDTGDLDTPIDQVSLSSETLRPGQVYSARARRETEANQFAATLLMPAAQLLRSYQDTVGRLEDGDSSAALRALTEVFGVSEDALLRRLTALLVQAPLELADGVEDTTGSSPQRTLEIDEDQLGAARSTTPALIIAGPGSGKTSTLVGRVAFLVREQNVSPDAILALTFSNKAAGEMRERIGALLAPAAQDGARIGERPRMPVISTIHAFCGDLLRRYAPHVGLRPDYRLVTDTDGYFLLREICSTLDLPHYLPLAAPAQHFPALLSAISRAKDELCDPEEYMAAAQMMAKDASTPEELEASVKAQEVARVYAAYQRALQSRGDADFGDLIMLTVKLMVEQPEVRNQLRTAHQQILVDEFQDINRAIGILLKTLAGPDGPLWAVGDADQAIYRFRGASPANLAQFTSDYPTATVHTLRRNYRSFAPVLACAAQVASEFLDGGERPRLIATRGGGHERAVTYGSAPSEDAELAGVAATIRAQEQAGRRLSDQVVLCRTRRQCQRVASALSSYGIPTLLSAPLFDQDDVKDLLALVSLLADSSGAGLLRVQRNPAFGFTRSDADAVIVEARRQAVSVVSLLTASVDAVAELTPEGREGLAKLGRALSALTQAPDVATGLARHIFGQSGAGPALLDTSNDLTGERREKASRIAQILAYARTYDDQRRTGLRSGRADWPGFLDYLRVVAALRQENGTSAGELLPEDGVRVMTVHASKGLEFPVVYLPGLADRRFPMQRQWEPAPLPQPLREHIGLGDARAVHLAEEACLFYVAITRARDELVLSHAERYGNMRYQPSPFLAPIRDALGSRLRVIKWSLPPALTARNGSATRGDGGGRKHGESRTAAPEPRPLTISALETYARCPKQYAYRYVHGLRPTEVGLATLRRSLHATLHELNERVVSARPELSRPTLHEALALFERAWTSALGNDSEQLQQADDGSERRAPTVELASRKDGPFDDMYRRHGRDIVARMWSSLASSPEETPHAQEPQTGAAHATFDHTVTVHVGDRDIQVSLDRVEHAPAPARALSTQRRKAAPPAAETEPRRVVRHKLGLAQDRAPDLRALLYRLAAEQTVGARADLLQQNLTTGEVLPLQIEPRRLSKLQEDLDELITGIEREEFAPTPSPTLCQSCPFLFVCPV